MHGIEGQAYSAMIDVCIHLATIDDLHMQFDIVIIISTDCVQATVQLSHTMVLKFVLVAMYFMKPGILAVK